MHIHCRYNNLDSIIEQNIREVGVHGRSVVGGKIILPTIAISNVLVIGRWWAAAGRSGTLVWRAAKGRLYWTVRAGSRRPPYITQHLGVRSAVC